MATRNLKRLLLITALQFLLIVDSSAIHARTFPPDPPVIQPYPTIQPPPETLVARVFFHDQAELVDLAVQFDVWEVNKAAGYLVAAMGREQYQRLIHEGYRLSVDEAKTSALTHQSEPLTGQTSGIPGFPCYRTVEETYVDLEQLASDHPNLANWIDIGDSWEKITSQGDEGYNIYALVLTNQDEKFPAPKPKFFLMAAIHAREYTTAELATRFAEHLIDNYGSDPDITWLLDYFEIHIVPIVNPDGRKIAETGYYQRKNANDSNGGACAVPPQVDDQFGTDLNRNHSFKWGGADNYACSLTYQGPGAISEPETQALENYLKAIFPDQRGGGENDPAPLTTTGAFISLHSYSELVLWPWGWTYQASPNESQLKTFGHKLAYFNQYTPQQSSDLYPTTGDSADFAYGELGVAAITFELGRAFFEECGSFDNSIYPDNLNTLLYAFKNARLPYINPSGPEVLDIALSSSIVFSGDPLTMTLKADDARVSPGVSVDAIAGARFSIDTPSWVTDTVSYSLDPVDGIFDSEVEFLQGVISTSVLKPGQHILFVESVDSAGNWGVPTAAFIGITDQKSTQYFPWISTR